ncbi:MAG TPA: TSUP family transporter [Kofleriaceae bacterium]|jgi:hypothetical protein
MTWLALEAIALAALALEGALGFGGTLAAVCLGAQLVPLRVLVPAFVPLDLAISLVLAVRGSRQIAWPLLARDIAPPVACGAAVGLVLGGGATATWLPVAFGVLVVVLAALELLRVSPRGGDRGVLALGGVAHGLFGTGGPLVVYVVRRRLADPGAFRATLAVLWVVLDAVLVAWLAATGRYTHDALVALGLLALALAPGVWLGERLHTRLPPRAAWLVLLASGAALALRG